MGYGKGLHKYIAGATKETRSSGTIKIVKVISRERGNHMGVKIRFMETGTVMWISYDTLLSGVIKDPYKPSVAGVGYFGVGPFTAYVKETRTPTKVYQMWSNILRRIYSIRPNPAYVDCAVEERWLNFQNFAADITAMPNWDTPGFELDKDLKIPGNRIYSRKACSFVPQEVNLFVRPSVKGVKQVGSITIPTGITANKCGTFTVRFNSEGIHETFTTLPEAVAYRREHLRKAGRKLARTYKAALDSQVYANLMAYVW